jgi:hypothetical protein
MIRIGDKTREAILPPKTGKNREKTRNDAISIGVMA